MPSATLRVVPTHQSVDKEAQIVPTPGFGTVFVPLRAALAANRLSLAPAVPQRVDAITFLSTSIRSSLGNFRPSLV